MVIDDDPLPAGSPSSDRLLRRGLKFNHLRLLATLAQTGQISLAAGRLNISQPAASRLLADLNRIVGETLYERHPRGIVLTPVGEQFAVWARRVLGDLDAASREISEMGSGRRGHVSIGAVTGAALEHVLPVLKQVRVTHPGISVHVVVDTSDRLASLMFSEQIDFYVGRIPPGHAPNQFAAEPIGEEQLSLIVRQEHPLTRIDDLTLRACVDYDWVMQAPEGLMRQTVENYLTARRAPLPARIISTASTLMALALISQSNAIAPLATAVAHFFRDAEGLGARLATLPVAQDMVVSTYSLLSNAGRPLSPASVIVHRRLRETIAASLQKIPGEGRLSKVI